MKKMGIDNSSITSRNNTSELRKYSHFSSSCSNLNLNYKEKDSNKIEKLNLEKQKWQFELSKIPFKNKSLGDINKKRMIEEKISKLDYEINKIIIEI
jgi:hypothetical protein